MLTTAATRSCERWRPSPRREIPPDAANLSDHLGDVGRTSGTAIGLDERAIRLGQHPVLGHPGQEGQAIPRPDHGRAHGEVKTEGKCSLQLPPRAAEPMEDDPAREAVPDGRDDVGRRTPRMDAQDLVAVGRTSLEDPGEGVLLGPSVRRVGRT